MGARLLGLGVSLLLIAAPAGAEAAEPATASSRMCANTYGGDAISATNNLPCTTARRVVRTWGVRYRRNGRINRSVLGYRCRGANGSVEGLTVACRRGTRVVRFYANVPR